MYTIYFVASIYCFLEYLEMMLHPKYQPSLFCLSPSLSKVPVLSLKPMTVLDKKAFRTDGGCSWTGNVDVYMAQPYSLLLLITIVSLRKNIVLEAVAAFKKLSSQLFSLINFL